jgi:hypothetical protein
MSVARPLRPPQGSYVSGQGGGGRRCRLWESRASPKFNAIAVSAECVQVILSSLFGRRHSSHRARLVHESIGVFAGRNHVAIADLSDEGEPGHACCSVVGISNISCALTLSTGLVHFLNFFEAACRSSFLSSCCCSWAGCRSIPTLGGGDGARVGFLVFF